MMDDKFFREGQYVMAAGDDVPDIIKGGVFDPGSWTGQPPSSGMSTGVKVGLVVGGLALAYLLLKK